MKYSSTISFGVLNPVTLLAMLQALLLPIAFRLYKILVINHGDIVKQQTHDELLVTGGIYAELYNSQFEEDIA